RITKLNFDNSEITRLDALVVELTTTISGLKSRINDLGSKTIPSSFINAASIKEITANGELTTATTEYNGALNDFQTKNNEFLKRDQDVMTAQNAFDTATRELSSLRTRSSDLALKIINHKTLIQTFASRIAKIPSLILTSQTLKNQLTTKFNKATNDKNALKPITDVHGEQLAMNHAKVLYDANLVSISTKASEVGTATSGATQAQREYDALKSNKDSLQLQLSSLTAGTPQYNSINLKLQKVKVKVAEKKTELDKKTNQLNALKQEERRLGALTQSLKSAFDNAKAAYDKAVINKAAYERKNQDLWNKIYDYNQKITIETNKIDSLNKELNNSKQSKATEEASLLSDQTQKDIIDKTKIPYKQTEITRLLATLNRNKQLRDNYKNTVLNPAITIMDQKQIIKDDKENIHNTKLDELNKLINEKTTKKALKIQKTNELDAAKKLLVDTHADKDMLSKPSDITQPIIDQNLSKEDQGKKFAEWAKNNPEPTSIAGLSDYITAMKNATNLKQVIRDIKKKEYSILINKYLHVVEETLKG
ncbi:MAG: hypothetical protein KAG04_02290, partial [Mycoplasmataceae bacterium]|nr:hypothetical protein [Mycoplasmataceae bacterium]